MSDARATIVKQRKALKVLRRITVLVALGGLGYLALRFEFMQLPEERPCPLVQFEPGDKLVIDGRPTALSVDDAVLVMTRDGIRRLCKIRLIREGDGHLWCVTDNPDCEGFSSTVAGWIDPRAVVGRVLMGWDH